MGMLVEDAQLYLRGKLIWRKKELHRPIVDLLPAHFEVYLDRDYRLNVLGLQAGDSVELEDPPHTIASNLKCENESR